MQEQSTKFFQQCHVLAVHDNQQVYGDNIDFIVTVFSSYKILFELAYFCCFVSSVDDNHICLCGYQVAIGIFVSSNPGYSPVKLLPELAGYLHNFQSLLAKIL